MEFEIIVPKLYEDMETSILREWLKKEGESVKKGEVLFTIETQKALFEVESEHEGKMEKILTQEGSDVNPLDTVGTISQE